MLLALPIAIDHHTLSPPLQVMEGYVKWTNQLKAEKDSK
jgi:hypothetical protein